VKIPALPKAVPARGNAATIGLGRLALRLGGWRVEGEFPDTPKAVIIVAPHTSNWDFVWGFSIKLALGLRASFLGKHTLFWGPAGPLLRWLGGIPVDRKVAQSVVEQTADAFRASERLYLAVAPEGTRKRVSHWKSGFYRIAVEADVPILPVSLDYRNRVIGLRPVFQTTGDYERDLPQLRALFRSDMAREPDRYCAT
jgi:1-acyl-sn-glycerol-3-phosphate acyltransferase